MSTKGPSNQYGNTNGSNGIGKPTKHINFAWAKKYKNKIEYHFKKHGKEFNCNSIEEYQAKAITFSNKVDRKNCKSLVDGRGYTYKYNLNTRELVKVSPSGEVVTYYTVKNAFKYYDKKGLVKWKIIK